MNLTVGLHAAHINFCNKYVKERSLGRDRHRWEDNIKVDLQEVECGGVWTGLSWLRIGTGGGHL